MATETYTTVGAINFAKKLKAYTGQAVPVVGKVNVNVTLAGRSAVLPLLVVHSSGPNLLGRNWMKALQYSVPQLHAVAVNESFGLGHQTKPRQPV